SAHMGGSPGSTTTGPVQRRTRVSRSETPPRCEHHRACLRCRLVSQKTSDTSRPDPLNAPALAALRSALALIGQLLIFKSLICHLLIWQLLICQLLLCQLL